MYMLNLSALCETGQQSVIGYASLYKVIGHCSRFTTISANCVGGDLLLLSWKTGSLQYERFQDRISLVDITFFKNKTNCYKRKCQRDEFDCHTCLKIVIFS